MNHEVYRELISGRTGGLAAAFVRCPLNLISWLYYPAVAIRNCLYSKGWLKTYAANAVVISIGNITVGGTGKTPLAIWLYRLLRLRNVPCAILTRGYKATQNSKLKTQNYIDEPALLANACPEAGLIVNPDRVAAAGEAVQQLGAKVLIMDDGFQHRRLQRDLDIVTIDATRPFGCGRLLPAGLLREPLTALKRADAVVITRCDQASESELTKIEKTLHQIKSALTIARSSHAAVCAKSVDNRQIPLEELKDKRIFAFCGIANPDAFFRTTRNLETDLLGSLAYNDHHRYTDNDISDIREKARALNADLILTTEKDFTRITVLRRAKNGIPFACLVIEVKFLAGEDGLRRLIEHTLAGKIQQQ